MVIAPFQRKAPIRETMESQVKTAPRRANAPRPAQSDVPGKDIPMIDDQTSLYRYFDREGAHLPPHLPGGEAPWRVSMPA